jgi:hypothetical protein
MHLFWGSEIFSFYFPVQLKNDRSTSQRVGKLASSRVSELASQQADRPESSHPFSAVAEKGWGNIQTG